MPGLIAERDYQVEGFTGQLGHQLGPLAADIDAQLGHDLDSPGVDLAGPHPGGKSLRLTGQIMVDQTFGHLAAAGVLAAKKEHLKHFFSSSMLVNAA